MLPYSARTRNGWFLQFWIIVFGQFANPGFLQDGKAALRAEIPIGDRGEQCLDIRDREDVFKVVNNGAEDIA